MKKPKAIVAWINRQRPQSRLFYTCRQYVIFTETEKYINSGLLEALIRTDLCVQDL